MQHKKLTGSFLIGHVQAPRYLMSGVIIILATLSTACSKPAFPDELEVRQRFQLDYRDANCKLVRIDPAKPQPDQKSQPFLYTHIRFEALCKDLHGTDVTIIRQQVWQLSRERPTLFQGAWRWTAAGEIPDY